jgi:hypothetical protein
MMVSADATATIANNSASTDDPQRLIRMFSLRGKFRARNRQTPAPEGKHSTLVSGVPMPGSP